MSTVSHAMNHVKIKYSKQMRCLMYNKDIKISEIPDEILEKGKEAIQDREEFLNN